MHWGDASSKLQKVMNQALRGLSSEKQTYKIKKILGP